METHTSLRARVRVRKDFFAKSNFLLMFIRNKDINKNLAFNWKRLINTLYLNWASSSDDVSFTVENIFGSTRDVFG